MLRELILPRWTIETKGIAEFKRNIRSAIRKFWIGEGDIDNFYANMERDIAKAYEQAWREGAATCGVKPDERTPEEQKKLNEFITNHKQYIFPFGEVIERNTRAEGGKLNPLMTRGELWVNRYNEVKNTAASMACSDMKLMWRWNPLKEHCFPKGTKVKCLFGEKNIEDVKINDLVFTTDGIRRVIDTFEREYQGDLIKVRSGKQEVICTPNHQFLTQRGWIEAGDLDLSDKVMLSQNIFNNLFGHIAFPNSFNNITTSIKIFILGLISFLLGILPVGKRIAARMTVPIIPISLNNKIAYLNVNNKLWLNQAMMFIFNTKLVKIASQLIFKFGRMFFLIFGSAFIHFSQNFITLVGIIRPKLLNLINNLWLKHRVIFGHIFFGLRMYNPMRCFFGKHDSQNSNPAQNLLVRHPNFFGYNFRAFGRIIFDKIFIKFISPEPALVHTFNAIVPFSAANDPTRSAGLFVTSSFGDLFSGIAYIPTSNRAILKSYPVLFGCRINELFKRVSANLTSKFSRFFCSWFHILSHCNVTELNTLYHNNLYVYNLGVADIENYVANGFTVHNCSTCRKLNGRVYRASTWAKMDIHPQDTRDGKLDCHGFRCGCSFVQTDAPITKGRPPRF